jgi:hypothetical protein
MPVDLAQFKRGLIYQDQASSASVSESLKQIREFDHGSEGVNRYVSLAIGFAFVIGLISGICILIMGLIFLLPVPIVCGVVAVAAIIYGQLIRKYDLQNRRYELVQELTGMLSRDMAKDAVFDLILDLAPPNESRKQTAKDKVNGWDVTYFVDPWLKLGGRFLDGTAFEIAMIDRVQDRRKWTRTPRGKSKHKSKTKTATIASVSLFPKQKKYSNLGQVTDRTPQLLKLPNWVRVKKVSADAEKLMVAVSTSEEWAVRKNDSNVEYDGTEVVITMLLSLYQVLNTAKALPRT